MGWTREQLAAINVRDKSVLVSAAAGSGKTAVLVERICNRITDTDNPADIDSFLVVTFTRAAAAQMKEKISAKLWEYLEKDPGNEHNKKQLVLINKADITTIDSFCLRIVKEYFSLLDIDSDFTIGDKGMIELIKADVSDKLFEQKYESEDKEQLEKFLMLVDLFGGDKDDSNLRELILKIHNLASSYPVPEKWYDNAKAVYTGTAVDCYSWIEAMKKLAYDIAGEAKRLAEYALTLTELDGGPYKNSEVAGKDIELIDRIINATTYKELNEAVCGIAWTRLKSCKGDEFDDSLTEQFKNVRDGYKKLIKELDIFKLSEADIQSEQKHVGAYIVPLIELVCEFEEDFMNEKKKRHVMEFSDIEHLAYELVCGENGPTEIGKTIAQRYSEIYIDEYQDSNYLQEDILMSVSSMYKGRYNVFMVGDVKQSIYRFRMARPELFVDKYNRFADYENSADSEVKILLKNNFRSRDVVLDSVNYFFYQLMSKDMGSVDYDADAALVPTKEFPEAAGDDNISSSTELFIIDTETDEEYDISGDEPDMCNAETEAVLIGNRIKELLDMDVLDELTGTYRKASYKDMVILLRSMTEYGNVLYSVLSDMGIPVYIEDPQGYFEATEIQVLMSMLAVIDNSRQDIPLAATLLSPIGGLCENDLAIICAGADIKACLYDKCLYYMEVCEDDISKKLNTFFDMVTELKKDKHIMSISKLILKVLDITGYYYYIAAMPMGERRKANVNMLVEKARRFESGSYKGLFNFLRYVEKLKVNEVDFGEANIIGDNEDVVRIMTMHKSKGLEFPIVFVSGLGKQFNMMDTRENVMLHADHYISSKLMYREKRYRRNSAMRYSVANIIKNEALSEELRVLYVAMTRAKEKLILTGCIKGYDSFCDRLGAELQYEDIVLPYSIRRSQKSFLGLIIAAMQRYDMLSKRFETNKLCICQSVVKKTELLTKRLTTSVCEAADAGLIIAGTGDYDEKLYKQYEKSFSYVYPYEELTKLKSKMSISEIKKMKAYGDEENIFEAGTDNIIVPQTTYEQGKSELKGALTGAERGTIVHKYMELLPFEELNTDDDYYEFIVSFKNRLAHKNVFDDIEQTAINPKKINLMLKSSLGQRMIVAARNNKLKKEQQFSAGVPVRDIYPETDSDELVIVQGIIDAFFYEGDYIILMDYKTDALDEEGLIGHYHAQLKYYASILERLTSCKVKEKLIYSFYLNKVIYIKED